MGCSQNAGPDSAITSSYVTYFENSLTLGFLLYTFKWSLLMVGLSFFFDLKKKIKEKKRDLFWNMWIKNISSIQ